jgi:8-oxo-dGTP pyrophosphatase MutT (NUDIX family)/L-amino acid N-acyltransferase YncA
MKINIHELKKRKLKYVVIVAKYEDQLIMVRHKDRTTYEIPGGHIEVGESPDEAAKRELFEETGAIDFELTSVGDYSVEESYGRLYFAKVNELGPLPASEIIEVTTVNDDMIWTYDKIQPFLLEFVENFNRIRTLTVDDAEAFLNLMKTLDDETTYMMFEPGERVTGADEMRLRIKHLLSGGISYVYDDGDLNGFISIGKGQCNRIKHTGYIVAGLKLIKSGQKIGTLLFNKMLTWANENNLHRLELTVMVPNESGVHLYKKMGFEIEGIKRDSMLVEGVYVDEYYMSKILEV